MSPTRTPILEDDIFTVEELLTPQQCVDWIRRTEEIGYAPAPINSVFGTVMRPDVRNNERVMFDDVDEAEKLWQLAREFVPDLPGITPIGLNERLRFYRYEVGQQFDWHSDGYHQRPNGEQSALTFMVYLNGDFEGGETSFLPSGMPGDSPPIAVRPEAGRALFFSHPLIHKGEPVTSGTKYVLRTDVMFRAR